MSTATITAAPWKSWLGLSAMALALFMMSTDITVLFIAQPAIAADLRPTAVQALWIVHVGEFLAASLVLTMGRLGDRVGRRRLLIIGIVGYAAASLLAAFAPSPETLTVARALLGASTAAVTPSAMALLRSMFPRQDQFSTAFAIVMTAFSGGMVLGPPIGGFLLEHFWWGVVFLINVPVAGYLLVVAPWTLPEFRDDRKVRLDPLSIALSIVTIMGLVYGLQELAGGPARLLPVVIAALGCVAGWLFVRRQRTLDDPLLDLAVFSPREVRIALIALFLVMVALTGPDVLVAPFLQIGLGLSSSTTGLLLLVPALLTIPAHMLAPLLKRRLGSRHGAAVSLATAAVGYAIAALALHLDSRTGLLVVLIAAFSLVALAGAGMTLMGELVLTSGSVQRTGTMSALQDVSIGLGSAAGIATLGTVSALLYRTNLSAPPDLSPADTTLAEESPGVAAELASDLSGESGDAFLDAVTSSMSLGLQTALWAAAAIAAAVVVLVLIGIRDRAEKAGEDE